MNRSRRRSAAEWSQLIAKFHSSALSEHQFCDEHDLVYATFRRWRSSLDHGGGKTAKFVPEHSRANDFIELKPMGSDDAQRITIEVNDEVRIHCPSSVGIQWIVQLAERIGR